MLSCHSPFTTSPLLTSLLCFIVFGQVLSNYFFFCASPFFFSFVVCLYCLLSLLCVLQFDQVLLHCLLASKLLLKLMPVLFSIIGRLPRDSFLFEKQIGLLILYLDVYLATRWAHLVWSSCHISVQHSLCSPLVSSPGLSISLS